MKKTPIFILIVIAILVVLGATYAVNQNTTQDTKTKNTNTGLTQGQEGSVDCGSDFDCLINAAQSCDQATLSRSLNIDLFGVDVILEESYTLLGMVEERCSLRYTSEAIGSKTKITRECKFKINELISSMRDWKVGILTSFPEDAICEEPIVDTTTTMPPLSPMPPILNLKLEDFPVQPHLPDDWRITSDIVTLVSEDYNRYQESEGLVAERRIDIAGSNDVVVKISMLKFDSRSNAKNFYDESSYSSSNIIGSECKSETRNGYSSSCSRSKGANYYGHVNVRVPEDNSTRQEEFQKGFSLVQKIAKEFPK